MNIKNFKKNLLGIDYAVGDIHGCFTKLKEKLEEIRFNTLCDRLFSAGDLVDRGPESDHVDQWLSKPWFFPVKGNHEQMAIDYVRFGGDITYIRNGGVWFIELPREQQEYIVSLFQELPILINVETAKGVVGIVHADPVLSDWGSLQMALNDHNSIAYENQCIWSRERITSCDGSVVKNVHAVICGHTPTENPVTLGNVHYIDTGAVFNREFTILNLETLKPV